MQSGHGEQAESDACLVQALRRGELEALDLLVDRYGDRVYGLAWQITGVKEDAEAATEDALRGVVHDIDSPTTGTALASRLFQLTARAAYEALRARRRTTRDLDLGDLLPPVASDGRHFKSVDDWSRRVDENALPREMRRVLDEALDGLPPDCRTVLVLHDVDGASNKDVADALGMSVAAVSSRVHRSRLFLRKRLSEHLAAA